MYRHLKTTDNSNTTVVNQTGSDKINYAEKNELLQTCLHFLDITNADYKKSAEAFAAASRDEEETKKILYLAYDRAKQLLKENKGHDAYKALCIMKTAEMYHHWEVSGTKRATLLAQKTVQQGFQVIERAQSATTKEDYDLIKKTIQEVYKLSNEVKEILTRVKVIHQCKSDYTQSIQLTAIVRKAREAQQEDVVKNTQQELWKLQQQVVKFMSLIPMEASGRQKLHDEVIKTQIKILYELNAEKQNNRENKAIESTQKTMNIHVAPPNTPTKLQRSLSANSFFQSANTSQDAFGITVGPATRRSPLKRKRR